MAQTFVKDPNAKRDYTVDWTDALPADVTIASVAWTVPTGIIQEGSASNTTTTATIRLSGGTISAPAVPYQIVCRVTLSSGEIDDRSIYIVMTER